MRLLAICLLTALVGCTTTRTITITSKPLGAEIDIDGQRQPPGPVTYEFSWNDDTPPHMVLATLPGYKPEPRTLTREYDKNTLELELRPNKKPLYISVLPAPAYISIDGTRIGNEMVSSMTTDELDFSTDRQTNLWITHTITAERAGFQPDTRRVSGADKDLGVLALNLKPMEKELNITTNPPGATITYDGETLGTSPLRTPNKVFDYDVKSESFKQHTIKANLPGFPEKAISIAWDNGETNYDIGLAPFSKTVKIHTEPPGGVVSIDGKQLTPDANGDSSDTLTFPPDSKGELKTHHLDITKETADAKWFPFSTDIAWDEDKLNYTFPLREIRTMPLALVSVNVERGANGWEIKSKIETTLANKDIDEKPAARLERITPPDLKGKNIDSLAISPDGKQLLVTVLNVLADKTDLQSVIYLVPTDGSSKPTALTDGQSLDITPSFSPDGEQIVLTSNRSSNRLEIRSISASGATGATVYPNNQSASFLWPCMDSSARPRIFYQADIDRLGRPIIYSQMVDGSLARDIGLDGGMQPRINAKNDSLLFCSYNEKTRKRDVFRVRDTGGPAENLTNSPDSDEYDATWDANGGRIAFVSDKGMNEDKQHNADIWMQDLTKPSAVPVQLTHNVSQDDCPVWDPRGREIYFRSNRGGEWGIWKIAVK